jgi:excisionase family DNA binding protein
MGTMLSAAEVERLLGVDASTVYRMAADGRLPGIRVGRQWRFPPEAIDGILRPHATVDPSGHPASSRDELAADAATAVLEAFAPALGVTMLVTDMAGRPLTPMVNPAPAIAIRLDDPDFRAGCGEEWAGFVQSPMLAPRFTSSRHGFLCAHSLIRQATTLVGMVLAGGVAPEGDDEGLFHLEEHDRHRVLETLPRVAALLSWFAPAR